MKRQRVRGSPYENIDEACYKWLVNARGRNIPISATVLKTKAKESGCNDFSALNEWLVRPMEKKEKTFLLRQFQVFLHTCFQFLR